MLQVSKLDKVSIVEVFEDWIKRQRKVESVGHVRRNVN